MEQLYLLKIAGITAKCRFLSGETAHYFGTYCEPCKETEADVVCSANELEERREYYPSGMADGMLEYNELAPVVSDYLLSRHRCVFHGAAFLWRGKAYIFTAPSGTGKTTQYVLWKILFGEEISILNGDKPVLEVKKDKSIRVYPSPWMGKEKMRSEITAPLGGIIYLEQGKCNEITRLPVREAVLPLFSQFLFRASTKDSIHQVCRMEEQILDSVPVWRMINQGDEASAQLAHDIILQFEEGTDEKL